MEDKAFISAFGLLFFIIIAIFILIIIAGAIILQVFLSKRNNIWLGLILPITTFLLSLLIILNIAFIDNVIQTIMTILITLILTNIPTMVLLVIYFACRVTTSKKDQIEKMKIQDL